MHVPFYYVYISYRKYTVRVIQGIRKIKGREYLTMLFVIPPLAQDILYHAEYKRRSAYIPVFTNQATPFLRLTPQISPDSAVNLSDHH